MIGGAAALDQHRLGPQLGDQHRADQEIRPLHRRLEIVRVAGQGGDLAVEELVDGLTTPPAVLFMTDGMMVIHPCFTPLLDADARSGLRGCRGGIVAQPRLSATELSAIFNRRDGERPINKVDVPANVDPQAEFLQQMQRLMARRFPDPGGGSSGLEQQAPLAWFPMHLDIRGRDYDQREVGRLLDSVRFADEIVVVGAHYDSVFECPGANDNGTGVAALLELATLLSRNHKTRFRAIPLPLVGVKRARTGVSS